MGITRSILNAISGQDIDPAKVTTEDLKFEAEQPQDVTSSRSNNTWETNTTGYPLAVYVWANHSSPSSGDRLSTDADVNTSQTINSMLRQQSQATEATSPIAHRHSLSFIVPPGHEYQIRVGGDGIALSSWYESRIGVSE